MDRPPLGPAEIVVDLAAIRANARLLRATAGVPLIAVVKADGYGHGMVESARAAQAGGAAWLATATVGEALALRAAGVSGPLLCWIRGNGDGPDSDLAAAVEAGVDVSVYSDEDLDAVAAAVHGRSEASEPARIQIKVDTGLSRGGAPRAAWDDLFAWARQGEKAGLWRVTGIWSHFACADEPDHPANHRQEQAFRDALALAGEHGLRPELRHLANSAAALLRPSSRFDAVRCGIALYGLDPAPGQATDIGLVPAMTVRAPCSWSRSSHPATPSRTVTAGSPSSRPRSAWSPWGTATASRATPPGPARPTPPRPSPSTASAARSAAPCAWTRSSSTSAATARRSAARSSCSARRVRAARPPRTGPRRAGPSTTRSSPGSGAG